MDVRRKDGEIFVSGFDDRELTEVRKLSRPSLTHAERRQGLVDLLARAGIEVEQDELIFVWA